MGKRIRQFLNLVFALVICFGLCSFTAYAEEDTGEGAEEASEEVSAAEPQDSEEVEAETVDTVVKNAIQTQIEDAINNLETPADCYVTVDDGTYDGNITLQGENLSNLGDKVLYILTKDSYTTKDDGGISKTVITANGSGAATVNGDIYIEGLTVVLGGIYLSMGNKITVIDSDTSIYGTTKDDNLTVDAGNDSTIKIDTGEGADTIVINGVNVSESVHESDTISGQIVIQLNGGAGADVYEIDTSVGNASGESPTAISINGGAEDRLHLTGSLDKENVDDVFHNSVETNIDESATYIQKKSSNEYNINLISGEGLWTLINSVGVGSFTDELENKNEVQFTPSSTPIENKTFIDYVISNIGTTPVNFSVDPSALKDNLAHSFSQIRLGKAGEVVNVGTVTTNGMNLLIVGKEVNVKGTIDTGSGNVIIRAKDSDEYNIDLSSMIPMPDSLENIVGSVVPNNGKASVFSIKSTASIDVDKDGTIKGNNIDLKSSSKQDQPLVPEVSEALKGINFIAVKIGKAVVNLKGTIQAVGSVIGRAVSAITTAASNENLAKWFIPIAAGVLLGEAGITIIGNITAKAIKLLADSTVNLEVASTVGALPVSIAVAGLENDSKVEVKGNANLKAQQNISMEATGKIKASTVSHAKNKEKKDEKGQQKGADTADGDGDGSEAAKTNGANTNSENGEAVPESGNIYGGFVAVSVAIQNVLAKVSENAVVESNLGSVNILAEALESVLTAAISYVPETADDAEEAGEDGEEDKDNGKAASDADTKSDKEGDDTDKRSVENSKDSAASLLTAAGNTKEENQIGDKLDSDDKDKINNLKKGITGDEKAESSEEGGEQQEGEGKQEDEKKQDGIDKVFDDATKSADPENDSATSVKKSSNQLAGALAVNVLLNTAKAMIETTKSVKAIEGTIRVLADAFTYSKAVANASQVQSSKDQDDVSVAVGAAVAINIVNHENVAEIKQGNIEAKELVVSANSGSEGLPVTVHTEAVAGHTDKSEYGIAGAVAVDVVSISTKSLIGETPKLVVTDGLQVKSVSNENIKTISTTNEELGESEAEVGVGVAVSVDVCGVDTIAQIGSENAQTVIDRNIAAMAIEAANNLVEDIEATAGATGKVGVSPSVTVVVSGANTESYAYFIPSTEITNISGYLDQNATNNVERTVSADAKAESQNGGSGALVVTVLNDSAHAKGRSVIDADNIRIHALSKSVLSKARARASSQGAMKNGGKTDGDSEDPDPAPPAPVPPAPAPIAGEGDGNDDSDSNKDSNTDGDQDKQADEAIDGAKNLSKKVGTKNVNENEIDKLTENRQKGQTAEGSISVAASFIVNIMSNESVAIFEVPEINAPNASIEIKSENVTSAYVFADSSSVAAKCDSNGQVESGSSVGVGVAVAINVINIKNDAHIKTNGDIKAESIIVSAKNAMDGQYGYDTNKIKTYAVSGAGAGNVGVAGSAAIAVINGYVDAYIDCGDKTITIAFPNEAKIGVFEIRADIYNEEETIASAALVNGEPDKNDKDKDGNENEGTADSKKADGNDGNKYSDDGKKIAEVNGDNKENGGGKPKEVNSKPPTDSNNNPKNPNAKAGEEDKSSSVGVGASFALNISSIETNAYINAAKINSECEIRIYATEHIDRFTFAVAGTDPVAKGAVATMNTVVDAAVALLIESDRVNAYISGKPVINGVSISIEAYHEGGARNQASGFAVGNQSAIGAAVAFIWSDSQSNATFDGTANIKSFVDIEAYTLDVDRSLALALARGTTEEKAKEDSDAQPGTKNNDNKTAEKINTSLNKTKSDKAEGKASNTKALSTNILKTQSVKTESTSTTDKNSETGKAVLEAEGTVNKEVTNKNQSGAGNNNISTDAKGTESKKVDLAAAIGILVADHKAETSVAGTINCSYTVFKAINYSTFSALGTAITMTNLPTTAAVALGVAVAINKAKAIVNLADGIKIETPENREQGVIQLTAEVKQNTDNNYFGAQAVSGSVASRQTSDENKVTAAGAVAILITDAEAQALVGNGATLKSDVIEIRAKDDYKLYVRAGSISYSTKANVGLGISYGMLYANDRVNALIGRDAVIECTRLDLEAAKAYENRYDDQGLKDYIAKAMEVYDGISSNKTVTAKGEGSEREVVVEDNGIKSIYTAQEVANIINIFVFDNYHVESFSGTATPGNGKFSGAGAVSFILLKTDVNAVIGENTNIKLIPEILHFEDYGEDYPSNYVNVHASDEADTGLYTIGVAVGSADNTAGASIAVLIDHSKVYAEIKNNAKIVSDEKASLSILADTDLNNLIVSVASAISGSGNNTIGGNVNVFVTDHKTKAQLHDGADIDVDRNIDIIADYANNTILVAAGVQGGKSGTAVAGGTLVVGIYNSDTEALVGSENSAKLTSLKSRTGDVNVKAESKDKTVSVLASASAAIGSKAGVAAVIDVLVSNAKTLAKVISKAEITAQKGNINVIASSDTKLTAVDAQASFASKGTAAGGTVAVGVFRRIVEAAVAKGCRLTAGGNVLISAYGDDRLLAILAAGSASAQNAIDGIIVVSVEENTIRAILESDKNAVSRIDADGSVGVSSYLDSDIMTIDAGINVGKGVAVGATISTVILNNTIESLVDPYASIYSGGLKALVIPSVTNGSKDKKRKIRGIAIDAGENSVFKLVSAAGSGSGKAAVEGVINTVVKTSKVHAYARGHNTLRTKVKEGSIPSDSDVPLDIQVVAKASNDIVNAAGSLAIGGKAGVGVSVVTLVNSAEVIAAIIDAEDINSESGGLKVDAAVTDNIVLVSLSFAGSGTAAVGVSPNVLVYNNTVKAYITGEGKHINARNDIAVTSAANADVNMLAAVVAGSGTAAVSTEGNITYFNNNSEAYVGNGVIVTTENGDITIKSITKENLNGVAAGLAGSGTVAVGGSADVVITNINSHAYTGTNVSITSGRSTNIEAIDEYGFIGVAGTNAASGTVAVPISVIVAVSHNTIKAEVGESNTINSAKDINIEAKSTRNISAFAETVGVSGTASVGVGVVVIVEGKGIDKDSYDNFYTKANIHPDEIASKGYATADRRANQAYSVDSLNSEINSSIEPTRDSAKAVADKGANGGGYGDYGNTDYVKREDGSTTMNTSIVDKTSNNLSGKIADATDVNVAFVNSKSVLTAGSNINVLSTENVSALVVAAGVGGATVGVGAGVSVVLINSNVSALVNNDAVLRAGKDINVDATLTHNKGNFDISKLQWETNKASAKASDTVDKARDSEKERRGTATSLSNYGVLIVSGAFGAGIVGVGVNVSYYNNSAYVRSNVYGVVCSENGNVNITSHADYANVGTFNVSLSGGAVGVSVSVSISTNEATVIAGLDTDKKDQENIARNGSINVAATTNAHLITINGALAAGGVAVSPVVAIANSRVASRAYIGGYTSIRAKAVDVTSSVDGDIEAYLYNAALGGVAVALTVVIANNKTENIAQVGYPVENTDRRGYVISDSLNITAKVNSNLYTYGFSGAGGIYSVNGVIVIASNDAVNNAFIYCMNTYVTNNIDILAGMSGSTKVEVDAIAAGVIGVGAVVAVANLNGTNKAYVDMRDYELRCKNLRVEAAGLRKDSAFNTEARTTVKTGTVGFKVVGINFVYAINNALNEALVDTYGQLTASESIKIIATGKSRALAVGVTGTAGGKAGTVTNVESVLSGTNRASLVGRANAIVNTDSLDVLSTSNDLKTKPSSVVIYIIGIPLTITTESAAEAHIVAGEVSAKSITANRVNAKSTMSVTSSVDFKGKILQLGNDKGNINVKVNGASTATAKSEQVDLKLKDLGVVVVNAEAAGEYKATWYNVAKETAINARNLNINNTFASKANAYFDPSRFGVAIKGLGIETNTATALASTKGEASSTGAIGIVKDSLNINSTGSTVSAYSYIKGAKFDASAVKLTASIAEAKIAVNNTAFIEGLLNTITAKNVSVIAKLNDVKSVARGGSNSSGVTFALADIQFSKIKATADVKNKAYVNDATIISTGKVSVRADVENLNDTTGEPGKKAVHVEVITDAPDFAMKVASAQLLETETDAVCTVTAKVTGRSNITAKQIEIIAADGTEVSSKGSVPQISIKFASGESVRVVTDAAKSRAREVVSEIGDKVTLNTSADLVVLALSDLDVSSHLNDVYNFSGINLAGYTLKAVIGNTITNVIVAGKLTSNGNVEILAKDNVNAHIDKFEALNAGLFDGGTVTVECNVKSQNAGVIIGNGSSCSIEAPTGSIAILAVSSGNIKNEIEQLGIKFGGKSDIYFINIYNRNTTVDIKNNTSIYSGFGIVINADAQKVNISSQATCKSVSAAEKVRPFVKITYNETSTVKIGGGCDITAQLGDNYIVAQSESDLYAKAHCSMVGGIHRVDPTAEVYSTVNLLVDVASDSSARTNIYGANVNIGTLIVSQKNVADTNAECRDFASHTEATSNVNPNNTLLVKIGNANISGYKTIRIYADIKSLKEDAKSYAKISGFTGKVYANSSVWGGTTGNIVVGNGKYNAALFGPEIFIDNGLTGIDTNSAIVRDATAKGETIVNYITRTIEKISYVAKKVAKWLIWPFNKLVEYIVDKVTEWVTETIKVITYSDAEARQKGTYTVSGNVDVNLDLHCGEYAAGINILIDDDKDALVTGIENPKDYITIKDDAITIHDIKQTKNGKFKITALNNQAKGTVNYYNTSYIPKLNIDNYTDLPLYISKIFLVGDVVRDDGLYVEVYMPNGVKLNNVLGVPSRVEIISHGKGDVIFTSGKGENGRSSYDDFDAGEGSIYIQMNGGNVYTEGNAFVVAGDFTVEGAGEVGHEDVSRPFNLYLSSGAKIDNEYLKRDADAASISLEANNTINIKITPVVQVFKDVQEVLSSAVSYIIKNLKANKVILNIVNQFYTTMDIPTYGTGKGTNSIREFLSYGAEYDATFWIDSLVADTLQVDVPAPRGNSKYNLYVASSGYNVNNLIQNLGDRVTWKLYKDKSELSGSIFNFFRRTTEPDYSTRLARESLDSKEKKVEKEKKDKLPGLKHLRKGQKKVVEEKKAIGNTSTPLGITGGIISKIMNAVDFALVVPIGNVSCCIVANDVSVNGIQKSLNNLAASSKSIIGKLGEIVTKAMEGIIGGAKKLFGKFLSLFS